MHFESTKSYGSDFSDCNSESESGGYKKEKDALFKKPESGKIGLIVGGRSNARPSKRLAHDLLDVEEGKRMRYHGLLAMDAYTRHKKLVKDYLLLYGGQYSDFKRDSSKDRTDSDVIKENHQFLWDDDDDSMSWEKRLAKKYWDKLYKEYAICDLSRYQENMVAFRWRVEKEVISGKGQFSCANKRCSDKEGLKSWEVNFAYREESEKKNALVKCRLCPDCSAKLNFYHKRKEVTTKKKKHKKEKQDKKKSKSDRKSDSASTSKSGADVVEDQEQKIWSKPLKLENEKSREEEFDDYFEGLFL